MCGVADDAIPHVPCPRIHLLPSLPGVYSIRFAARYTLIFFTCPITTPSALISSTSIDATAAAVKSSSWINFSDPSVLNCLRTSENASAATSRMTFSARYTTLARQFFLLLSNGILYLNIAQQSRCG